MKKLLCVLMAAILTVGSLCLTAGAAEEKDKTLQFHEDGSFRILQIADIQDIVTFRELTANFLSDVIDMTQPDLIVLTGDNIAPGSGGTTLLTKIGINNFMSIFEEKGVKVTAVFGNHDYDHNIMSKEAQWKIYESYDCFVGTGDTEELTGYGTYNLPIMSSKDETKKAFNLWFFDSQMKNTENDLGGYGCTAKDQIDWYIRTEKALTEENGGITLPSMAFQHIIVPEIYDVLTHVYQIERDKDNKKDPGKLEILVPPSSYDKKYFIEYEDGGYVMPEEYIDEETFLHESCCPPKYSNGQADAMVENGNVLGFAFGHDHVNCFVVPYKGMDLIQTPTASFGSYGDESRGVRVIDLNENDTSKYETEMIFFNEVYDLSDPLLYNRYVFNSDGDSFTSSERFVAMCKYCYYSVVYKLEAFFSGFEAVFSK